MASTVFEKGRQKKLNTVWEDTSNSVLSSFLILTQQQPII